MVRFPWVWFPVATCVAPVPKVVVSPLVLTKPVSVLVLSSLLSRLSLTNFSLG